MITASVPTVKMSSGVGSLVLAFYSDFPATSRSGIVMNSWIMTAESGPRISARCKVAKIFIVWGKCVFRLAMWYSNHSLVAVASVISCTE